MKKGFTLVELLAVIVVLAVIALIVIPILLKVINNAKEASALRSAEGYMRAISNKIALSNLNEIKINDGIYNVKDEIVNVEYNGNGPTIGMITISKGLVLSAKLCIDGVSIDYETNKINISSNNYCLKNELFVDGEKIENERNLTTLTIEKKAGTNIVCNAGVTISEIDDKIKIENILGKVECKFSNSLVTSISKMDNTENYILMLDDETLPSALNISSTKNLVLNLNGKTVSVANVQFAIRNKGNFTINGNNGTVNYENECEITDKVCYTLISEGNSNLTLENVNITSKQKARAIGIIGNSTASISNSRINCNNGDCIWDNGTNVMRVSDTEINSSGYSISLSNSGSLDIINSEIKSTNSYAAYNKSNEGTINIKDSLLTSENKDAVSLSEDAYNGINNGSININNSEVRGNGYAIINGSTDKGVINLNGGIYISKDITIMNLHSGTININDDGKKIYIASYKKADVTDINKSKAIKNNSNGNISIKGEIADVCNKNKDDTLKGVCLYNEFGRTVVSDTDSNGKINIQGAYVVSEQSVAVDNFIGNINICKSKIKGFTSDLRIYKSSTSTELGYIYYDNITQLVNNTKSDDYNNPSHIILKEDCVCQ